MGTNLILNRVNINGIPTVESRSITESTTSVVYNFGATPITSPRFSGIIAVRITEAPTTTTLPVSFNVPSIAGTLIALTGFDGAAVTAADLPVGIHLVFYDRFNGVLQLLV